MPLDADLIDGQGDAERRQLRRAVISALQLCLRGQEIKAHLRQQLAMSPQCFSIFAILRQCLLNEGKGPIGLAEGRISLRQIHPRLDMIFIQG